MAYINNTFLCDAHQPGFIAGFVVEYVEEKEAGLAYKIIVNEHLSEISAVE
jgi:hypothetical protein